MKSGPFVQVLSDRFQDLTCRHRLDHQTERGLLKLVLLADWRTHTVENFTLTDFAELLGLGSQSGRRTASKVVRSLEAVGAVAYTPAKGSAAGSVKVLWYGEVVHNATDPNETAETQPRAQRAASRALRARPRWEFAHIDVTDKQTPLPPTAAEAAVALEEPRGATPPSDPPPRSQLREVNQRPVQRQRRRHSSRALGTNPRALARRASEEAETTKRRQEQLVAARTYGELVGNLGLVPAEEFPSMALDAAARAGWPPEVTAVALDAFGAALGARAG